jgi:hypothetical protein
MRRRMIVEIHLNPAPIKAFDCRHEESSAENAVVQ